MGDGRKPTMGVLLARNIATKRLSGNGLSSRNHLDIFKGCDCGAGGEVGGVCVGCVLRGATGWHGGKVWTVCVRGAFTASVVVCGGRVCGLWVWLSTF